MSANAASAALHRVVFPAPDGAEMMKIKDFRDAAGAGAAGRVRVGEGRRSIRYSEASFSSAKRWEIVSA